MVLIAIGGKSNTGKSTFFSAATAHEVEISNRIFTTIKPNRGIAWVQKACPCQRLGVRCAPKNSRCINGIRYIPIQLLDVAGLVPGAHEGRGLGNQFLDEMMDADAIIHIVDLSGGTDQDGNPIKPGTRDPNDDIITFEQEIDFWFLGILERAWDSIKRKVTLEKKKLEDVIAEKFSGIRIDRDAVKKAIESTEFSLNDKKAEFVSSLRKISKPIVIAGNKADMPEAKKNLKNVNAIPVSADAELALIRAAQKGIIEYRPGDSDFKIIKSIEPGQEKVLLYIRESVLKPFGSTGVQRILNHVVFDVLGYIVVYPVANISKLTDNAGNVLPDAFLVKKGTKLRDFAYMVHKEIGEKFIGGLGLDKKRLGADYELKDGDIVEILFKG
ncbi:MAG: redox-regulated ATPase YchF [Candidatus Aenigmatarchaeota archaeon]